MGVIFSQKGGMSARQVNVRKTLISILILVVWLILLSIFAGRGSQELALAQSTSPGVTDAALGTSFTYQGRLVESGEPANGSFDLRFSLYNANNGGSQVGSSILREDLALNDGFFTLLLDFGAIFDGQALWLEVSVRPGNSTGTYTIMTPRQPLTAAPYAIFSSKSPWSGLSGIPAGFADGADNDTTYSAGNGLSLSGGQFSVVFAGSGSAVSAAHSDHIHMGQSWSGNNNALNISGSFDTQGSPAPLVLSNQSGSGLVITTADKYGVAVNSAGWDGIRVDSAGGSGISVDSATYYGMSISSAGWAGVLVNSTTGDGIHVNSADDSGVAVVTAGNYGVWAGSSNPSAEGGHFENTAAGGAGLYARGGSNSAADLVLGGSSASDDDGRIRSDPAYNGSDLMMVSNDAFQIDLDNDNNESGDFWILNGANTTVFVVNEAGNMTAIGTKSAAVTTEDYGQRKLYAVESPENWFEDFGSSQLVNGSATVAIEPVFAQTVNLNEDYFVYLTPLGDCALYVAEKTAQGFTVKAMGGQPCGIAFDYRIVARRLGYESLRLEPATDLARESGE